MGIHVILDIDPRGIDKASWAHAYEETLALLESWQPPLLGWGVRTFGDVKIPIYARSIRHGEQEPHEAGCSVVGDRESMRTAERQSLYRDLDRYVRHTSHAPQDDDIVLAAVAPDRSDTGGPVTVFGNKTQGHPYHFAMLAAAMLIEERFPHHAMACGDIDRGQAEQARKMASPILGRDLELPVRVDPPRLIERLRTRFDGDALISAFDRLFLDEPIARNESILRLFPGPQGARHWLRKLAAYETPRALGGIGLLIAWLNAGRDLREACHRACIDPEGPRFPPEDFVAALASTWVATPLPLRESLFALRKPRGESHTIDTLLGSWALDRTGGVGRHLRIHIEPPTLASVLADVFGTKGPALAEHLFNENAKHEEALRGIAEGLQGSLEPPQMSVEDSLALLMTLRCPDEMTKVQRLFVHTVACTTSKLLANLLRETEPEQARHLTDPDKAKLVLARALRERGPVLTEDAWDDIFGTNDPDLLAWLVALAIQGNHGLSIHQVRHAFFENAELRRYAFRTSRDPKAMTELEQLRSMAPILEKLTLEG